MFAGNLSVSEHRHLAVNQQVTVALARLADVNAQLPGNRQGLIPCFNRAGSVWLVRRAFLRETERLIPRILVTLVHGAKKLSAITDLLRVDDRRDRKKANEESSFESVHPLPVYGRLDERST
jgi:cob(I)alamin adenosyltransferase